MEEARIEELEERLRLIYESALDALAYHASSLSRPVANEFKRINEIANLEKEIDDIIKDLSNISNKDHCPDDKIIISCDASITKNPGGDAAVGFVIRFPEKEEIPEIKMSRRTPSKTNNEAEYDAVYEGLVTLFNKHTPLYPVEVRSDSMLVVRQLNGTYKSNKPELSRKAQSIHELVRATGHPVTIEWRERNSTPDLMSANFLAQDLLGVKRH
jgi:ribonuclease HI